MTLPLWTYTYYNEQATPALLVEYHVLVCDLGSFVNHPLTHYFARLVNPGLSVTLVSLFNMQVSLTEFSQSPSTSDIETGISGKTFSLHTTVVTKDT